MRKHITAEIEKNQKAIELHVTQTVSEAESSLKSHIGVAIKGVTRHEQDAQIQNKRDRLLRSLKFDRMNERRNQVTSSHHNTFTWMLRDGSDVEGSQRPTEIFDHKYSSSWQDHRDNWELSYARTSWDSFSDWLRSTDSVYWISGKPGSGKTTLMKYILGQPQTQTYLDQWKPDAIIISHFFWRPGTVMQQSIKGLMSSLLHQLLLGEPGVVDHVLLSTADMPRKDSETDWSTEELQETLHYVISRYPRPIAIFLDGLDEVLPGDGVLRLLKIVDQLRQPCGHTGKIKLCLGSRQEALLYKHLCCYPQLRLEQLNHVDLWKYGKDHVIIPSDYRIVIPYDYAMYYPGPKYPRETPPSRDEFREWLVETLVTKAEGVFLWLCLTVATVTKALNQDETVEDLEARIQSLPSDLADLYAEMWNRMNDDGSHLRVRAASYLQLALAHTGSALEYPLNLFTMMVSTTPDKAEILLQPDPSRRTSVTSLIEACEKTRRDIMNRCTGLLVCPSPLEFEVDPINTDLLHPWYGEEYYKLIPYVSEFPVYSFLHRTARDFLTDTEAGQGILSWGEFPGRLSKLKLLEARLAICQLFRTPLSFVINGKDIGFLRRSSMVWGVLEGLWRSIRMEEDASTRQEVSRLLLLCEQLFDHGQLFGSPKVPASTMQFEQEPRHPQYHISYDVTVRGQHEFLIEAADFGRYHSGSWSHLLPVIRNRHLDEYTKCQLLVHACTFHVTYNNLFVGMDCRLDSIQGLLGWGASPYQQCLNRNRRCIASLAVVMTTETPFKALITSIWTAATNFVIDNNLRRKLFELISLFIMNGADPHEEIHIAIQAKHGRIEFKDLWDSLYESEIKKSPEGSPTEFGHILIILAYPASALLANILQIWKVADHSEVDWVPKLCELPRSRVGKGRPISIVELGDVSEKKSLYTPQLFLSTGIFNMRDEAGMEKHFLGLIRLAEDSLQGVVAEGKKLLNEYPGGCLSHVSVPLEIQAEMAAGLQRLRSTNVPVTERRKELRTRLGVITPLEEPEWQNSTDVLPSSYLVPRTFPSEDGPSKEKGGAEE